MTKKSPTFLGRIITSVLAGIIDAIPVLSGVVNAAKQRRAEMAPEIVEPETLPVVRGVFNFATVTTIIGIVLNIVVNFKAGVVDCQGLTSLLQVLGIIQ